MAGLDPEIESRVLRLPPKERARLAERLISSLDESMDAENEKLWLEESERRLDELESGRVHAVPAEKVFKDARSRLR